MPQADRKLSYSGGPGSWRKLAVGAVILVCGGATSVDAHAGRRRALARTAFRGAATTAAVSSQQGRAVPSGPGSGGRVQFVTDKRAYLDRGTRDGLAVNQSIPIFRAGRPVASCTIETVADHQSTCVGARLRAGDTFRMTVRNRVKKSPPVAELPPLVAEETLRARAGAIGESAIEKVDFSGVRAFGGRTRVRLTPAITIWRTQNDSGGSYTQESIDGAIQVFDVGAPGIRFDAAFSAMRWVGPSAVDRFRPDQQTQFYLWEAEFSKRRREANTVFAVGRIWPWHTPGLTILDGIQVGRHNDSETAEAGLYAGLLPWTLSVKPSSAWATGVYGTLVQTGSNKALFRLARQEARVGIWNSGDVGMVAEGEGLAQVWLGAWNLGAGGRLRRAAALGTAPIIDRAYLDIGARATLIFGGGLHVRYFGAGLPDDALLRAEVPSLRGSLHATGDAHWDPFAWLGFAGCAGLHRDKDSGRGQNYEAVELRLPRLIRDAGGISIGGEIEQGWMRGQLLYAQLMARLGTRFQILLRTSASGTEFTDPATSGNIHELGAYAHLDGAIASWLRLRAWSMLRVPIRVQGELPAIPSTGSIVGMSLTGVF